MGRIRQKLRRLSASAAIGFISAIIACSSVGGVVSAEAATGQRMALFNSAAQEFGVPAELLLAISYNQSRWQSHGAEASVDGGFGLMNLTTKVATTDGRGDPNRPLPKTTAQVGTHYTLDEAAAALNVSAESLKTSDRQNVRAGAALLAKYAKQANNSPQPISLNDWYGAVAQFGGGVNKAMASSFADSVFSTLQNGASLTTLDNQQLQIPAQKSLQPKKDTLRKLALPDGPQTQALDQQRASGNVECPASLNCRFIPAAYANNNPADPTDYGNFDSADRPRDMKIKYLVIHDTEGSYESAINHFLDPTAYVSCNYIIRSSDGAITQMVRNNDVQWCAGDWYVNMHSINIEHEGIAAQGATWYTEAMYRSSATLVRYLAHKYNIPLDRQHIVGHNEIPGLAPVFVARQHYDPGPYWDWAHYMDLVQGRTDSMSSSIQKHVQKQIERHISRRARVVKIAPEFATNQPPIMDCSSGTCTTLPAQGSNFVYLRTQPNDSAPLLSDPHLHPDGAPGTTNIGDWSAKATTGEEFVVAERQGDWTAIWFGGQKGWFFNPDDDNTIPTRATTITPKPGLASIPVYGGAYPEDSAYPATITPRARTPIYTIPAGQSYPLSDSRLQTDYFYDITYNFSFPDDHMIVRGNDVFYHINFNHRFVFVKASDVVLN